MFVLSFLLQTEGVPDDVVEVFPNGTWSLVHTSTGDAVLSEPRVVASSVPEKHDVLASTVSHIFTLNEVSFGYMYSRRSFFQLIILHPGSLYVWMLLSVLKMFNVKTASDLRLTFAGMSFLLVFFKLVPPSVLVLLL